MTPVVDASTLIAFAAAGHLHLLQRVHGTVLVPRAVWREVAGAGRRPGADAIRAAEWIERCDVRSRAAVARMPRSLGSGEREAIVLARERKTVVMTDDEAAYRCARTRRVRVVRTLTLLAVMKSRGIVPACAPILASLRTHGYFLSDDVAERFLRSVDESPRS